MADVAIYENADGIEKWTEAGDQSRARARRIAGYGVAAELLHDVRRGSLLRNRGKGDRFSRSKSVPSN